ncbi:MAG: sensor histidine kinase N-terminal domain-containing protein [Rhodobacter sp.]|nr:sensor histidine kinase N-terminal domain-containing protein [Rhodobacter sp.]
MKRPGSLQARLALSLGVLLSLLWIAAASLTTVLVRHEMGEVFDSALEETAQRILPLAVVDILGREVDGVTQRLGAIRDHDEYFTYVVRDQTGRVLLQSHAADLAAFPPYDGQGFRQTATHRIYNDDAVQGSVRISVAEPLDHRAAVARQIQIGLGLPLLVMIPLMLVAVVLAARASLSPLRRFRQRLEARQVRDLAPLPTADLPAEILPVATTLNAFLQRLKDAFEAERSFAANAAHELRTPLAGAIAQAQRLAAETGDADVAKRAGEIESALKRLTRMSERLLQLARAEGGPLLLDHSTDLRAVAGIVLQDLARLPWADRIVSHLPARPVLSDLDPDAFGIICRNLVENALRHGSPDEPVEVKLDEDGTFSVANGGPVVPPATLDQLANRFERGTATGDGSGLGLAIVAAMAERISTRLVLRSPRPGGKSGFDARLRLPVNPQGTAG